ncbi:hypothetical protein [Halopiger xanaduensis]|uniref:Uncharacterized protein n=1 Tax=Halopiger xanaduensis (strain DSM 18323 / JCM 14033 / SH-6) TaxID=797210 RepID=F8DBA0_HALXS|nr:hypothetical protein [Halopiger xanaduensis]AEH35876.1 hypothetical protein Halxa_1243 [Halopiger xanaduensis SH-6]
MGYSLHYYDLVLGCIGGSLAAGALIGYFTPIALEVSIAALGVVALAFIGHALFVNGPVDDTEDLTEEVDVDEVPQVLSPTESAD